MVLSISSFVRQGLTAATLKLLYYGHIEVGRSVPNCGCITQFVYSLARKKTMFKRNILEVMQRTKQLFIHARKKNRLKEPGKTVKNQIHQLRGHEIPRHSSE